MNDGCINGGFNIKRNMISDESMIIKDFENNINIRINDEDITRDQLVEKLYYNNTNNNNNIKPNRKLPIQELENMDTDQTHQRPLEPGQIDPATFFASSLKGLF
jgi:hypothetical protein